MTVIISDFEIIIEQPETPASEAPAGNQSTVPPGGAVPLTPLDLYLLDEHRRRRQARLAAG